jgi:aminoglycoside 6'-N-acetyltransferase I
MRIVSVHDAMPAQLDEAAAVYVAALTRPPATPPEFDDVREEVADFFDADRTAFLALDGDRVVGWTGAILHSPTLWELHPLVVHPDCQRRGVGTALVRALEDAAAAAGVCTIWLGADDDFGGTNLYGVELYPDALSRLAALRETRGHPFTFYARVGFAVVGVIPDASGPGRPDILMAKRIGRHGSE